MKVSKKRPMKHSIVQISRNAFKHNLSFFKGIVPDALLSPVVKANAYGHGLAEMTSLAKDFGVPMLMVNYACEAIFLRKSGYQGRVVTVGPFPDKSVLKDVVEADAELTVSNMDALDSWLALPAKCKIHLKFNTGLNLSLIHISEPTRPY